MLLNCVSNVEISRLRFTIFKLNCRSWFKFRDSECWNFKIWISKVVAQLFWLKCRNSDIWNKHPQKMYTNFRNSKLVSRTLTTSIILSEWDRVIIFFWSGSSSEFSIHPSSIRDFFIRVSSIYQTKISS